MLYNIMNFCDSSDYLVKSLLPGFAKSKHDRPVNSDMINLLSTLYEDILSVDVRRVMPKKSASVILPHCLTTASIYFPKEIRHYITNTPIVEQFVISVGAAYTVYISYFDKIIKKDYALLCAKLKDVFAWLTLCRRLSLTKTCAETLEVHIFMTPFEKHLPTVKDQPLSPEHVNSAFTLDCAKAGEIVVYRAEEWFKVLVHETFHTFGLDIGDAQIISQKLEELFQIQSDFRVAEAYAETFARIINCAFCSLRSSKRNKTTFLLYMEFCLQLERIFAIYQAHKILRYMGISYKDIILKTKLEPRYQEKTNVFAYYILTALLLNAYPDFLIWCAKHNPSFIQYARGNESVHRSFNDFIEHHYLQLQETVDVRSSHALQSTSRMSLL